MRAANGADHAPAASPAQAGGAAGRTRVAPLYFGAAGRKLFGWYHAAPEPSTARPFTGAVICNPFGYEEICAHRTLRELAESLAASGIPCLRFDYDGTGNSSGSDHDPDRVAAWCHSIGDAVDTLKSLTGCDSICLVGLRLGATLAAIACGGRTDILALVALAPVVRGRGYLREMRIKSATEGQDSVPAGDGSLFCSGFLLTPQTVADLERIDLELDAAQGTVPALVVVRSDIPQPGSWTEAMLRSGRPVVRQDFAGYPELMTSPHAAIVPTQTIRQAIEWLLEIATCGRTRDAPAAVAATSSIPDCATSRIDADTTPVVESARYLDPANGLFAIVTQPDIAQGGGRPCRDAVVLLNAGATHHVGPNRMHVDLARSWARRGAVVLRVDLRGLGDSARRPEVEGVDTYPSSALEDVAAAVAWLHAHHPGSHITVLGICSGAYHALKAAAAGLAVHQAIVINPLTFSWVPGTPLDIDTVQPHEVASNARAYTASLLKWRSWAKLARGSVDIARVARVMGQRLRMEASSLGRQALAFLGFKTHVGLESELKAVQAAGVQLHFIFASGDPGQDLLRIQGGREARRLQQAGRVVVIEGADHVFRGIAGRSRLAEALGALIVRRHDDDPVVPAMQT
jgi:alpha/beta superfamily hydrolase